jgi:hypothetical protein
LARCFEVELDRLDAPDCYFNQISCEIKPKRDRLAKLLCDAGFIPILPDGGFFILADFSQLIKDLDAEKEADEEMDVYFNKYLIKKGLSSFPASKFQIFFFTILIALNLPFFLGKFFAKANKIGENLLRFCFVKVNKI